MPDIDGEGDFDNIEQVVPASQNAKIRDYLTNELYMIQARIRKLQSEDKKIWHVVGVQSPPQDKLTLQSQIIFLEGYQNGLAKACALFSKESKTPATKQVSSSNKKGLSGFVERVADMEIIEDGDEV
jgi:hypothetical protein